MSTLWPHSGLAFPYNIAMGREPWGILPLAVRWGTIGILGTSALLALSVPSAGSLQQRGQRLSKVISHVQCALVLGLVLLLLGELLVAVCTGVGLIGLVVDSGLAKVQLALVAIAENLTWFGTWGAWAASSAALALFLFYAARTYQVPSHTTSEPDARGIPAHILLAAVATAILVGTSLRFGSALRHLIHPLDASTVNCWTAHTLECVDRAALLGLRRGYHEAFGCTLAAALCLAFAEAKRPRAGAMPRATRWARRSLAAVLSLLAATLTVFTQPLARESAAAIPTDHTFANLTLSIPPPLPYARGIGPDAAYFGGSATMRLGLREASRWTLPEATSPNGLYRLLRNERERQHGLGGPIDNRERGFDISVDERMSPQQLREWLASLAAARIQRVALVLSDVIELDRPVLGKLVGAKWSAARFEIRSNPEDCVQSHDVVTDLTWPTSETTPNLVRRIIDARRHGQTLCLAVGDQVCLSGESRHPDCWDRLAHSVTLVRDLPPATGLRAARVRMDGAEFDVLAVDDRAKIRCRFDGPRTLPEVRRAWEQRGCTVFMTMNAGMYEPNFEPVGLFISEGRVRQPLNVRDDIGNFYLKPNGVFAVSAREARVVFGQSAYELFANAKAASLAEMGWNATQSGPLLLMAGREHPAFDANSQHRAIRNAVGVRGRDAAATRVLFAISNTKVTFHEFATLFTQLGYTDALYLDGNVSNMDLPALERSVGNQRLGPTLAVVDCSQPGHP